MKCAPGEIFDCVCGDRYFQKVQDHHSDMILEIDPLELVQVMTCQKQVDQRLASRIVKLHDFVASASRGKQEVSTYVVKVVIAIRTAQAAVQETHPFLAAVVYSAFTNYFAQYYDVLREHYFANK